MESLASLVAFGANQVAVDIPVVCWGRLVKTYMNINKLKLTKLNKLNTSPLDRGVHALVAVRVRLSSTSTGGRWTTPKRVILRARASIQDAELPLEQPKMTTHNIIQLQQASKQASMLRSSVNAKPKFF